MQHPIFNDSNKFCAWLVEELGPQFKKYVNQFIDDGINGELISSLELDEWSGLIVDPNHRRALTRAVVGMMDFHTPGVKTELSCPKEHVRMAVRQLDVQDIVTWLQMIGAEFEQYGQVFLDNGVDGALLTVLAPEDLAELVPDPIHRSAVMDEIADPNLNFLTAILSQKPGSRAGHGSYRRRSVVVESNAIKNGDTPRSPEGDEVSKYFDNQLEISERNDNLLPWLTVNGFASYHLTLTSKGCTWEIFESITSPQYLEQLGVLQADAESMFLRIQEWRAGNEAELDTPRYSGASRQRSERTDSFHYDSYSDLSEIEEISRLKIDWMVLAITKHLQPDNVACDFLSKLWSLGINSRSAENDRRRLMLEYRTEVHNTIIQKAQDLVREHKDNLSLKFKDELTCLARLAFALDATVPSFFAEVPGSMYTLPRQLVLELFDFGVDCDRNGFPLWFSSEEDRGTLFHAFLCGIISSGDQVNFHTLRAIGPHIEVHTQRGSSALDVVATGLHDQDPRKAEVCCNLYMQLQQYGFLRTSLSSTAKENDLHALFHAIEKETRSTVMSCNWLKIEVRTAIAEYLIGFRL